MNIQNAPADFDFYGPGGSHLWCQSSTETLHFWGWAEAAAEPERDVTELAGELEGQPDDMHHFVGAREQLAAAMEGQPAWRGSVRCSCD
jgi:hypothetical protein